MKITKLILIGIIFIQTIIFGYANDYDIANIPDSLVQNADVVIREYNKTFVQSDINNATLKVKVVMTVLNKKGEGYSVFRTNGDKFTELTDFSGVIKNASGVIVKKVKKGDLFTSSIDFGSLATGDYTMGYTFVSPTYPYTIEYTYQQKLKNGIIYYPPFTPFVGYNHSVENASMTLELPMNIVLRKQINNLNAEVEKKVIDNKNVFNISVNDLKAMKSEPFAPQYVDVFPRVVFAPADFCYDSYCGNIGTWKNYGLWVHKLLEGRDVVSPDLKNKINQLTQNVKSDREKVKIIYEYLQNNSRYVSIQLGIGGFQPIAASSVASSGFGDCKGLANLMKALLNTVNIESNYCEIRLDRSSKRLKENFSSIEQTNHAILLVPLPNDSIWLECTSQTMPFGYIHQGIAGHDALVISSEGGKICRLPSYDDKLNNRTVNAHFRISEDGSVEGDLNIKDHLAEWEGTNYLSRVNERQKLVAYVNDVLVLPKMQIEEIKMQEDRSMLPYTELTAKFKTFDMVNKTGNRFFMSISPTDKNEFSYFAANDRSLDINFPNGFSQTDSMTFIIPDTFQPENLPKDIELITPFGKFSTKVMIKGNMITYIQYVEVNSGRYSKDSYKDIKSFYAQIVAASKRKLVLMKGA